MPISGRNLPGLRASQDQLQGHLMADLNLTRRNMLKGTAALALTHGWLPTAYANQQATLRAAISGFGVLNTLDPGKFGLISEAYIIYGLFDGLLGFDPDMNLKPEL